MIWFIIALFSLHSLFSMCFISNWWITMVNTNSTSLTSEFSYVDSSCSKIFFKNSTSVKAPNISTLYPNSIIFLNLLKVLYTWLVSLSLTFQSDILFFLKNSLNKVSNMNTVTRARNICSPSLTGFHKCHGTMYIHTFHRLYTGTKCKRLLF